MEKILAKLENIIDTQSKKLEDSPVKTTLKFLVILYCLKKVYGWVKES